jgi:hypothetical protein
MSSHSETGAVPNTTPGVTRLDVPVIFIVTYFRQSIPVEHHRLRAFASMCRYDVGFHAPHYASMIVFPSFRRQTDGSTYAEKITLDRWQASAMHVEPFVQGGAAYDVLMDHPVEDWISYRRPSGFVGLGPVTLDEWLKANPHFSINGWRNMACEPVVNDRFTDPDTQPLRRRQFVN